MDPTMGGVETRAPWAAGPSVGAIAAPSAPLRQAPSRGNMATFQQSPGIARLNALIARWCEAATGKDNYSVQVQLTPPTTALVAALRKIRQVAIDTPLRDRMRFGNPAMKDFNVILLSMAPQLLPVAAAVGDDTTADHSKPESLARSAARELHGNLAASLGNPQRLDFGSGHESSFALVLAGLYAAAERDGDDAACLAQLPLLRAEDDAAVAVHVWPTYMTVARAVQSRFTLEPAGSAGVWGFDDFHHLCFAIGAAQLQGRGEEDGSGAPHVPSNEPVRAQALVGMMRAAEAEARAATRAGRDGASADASAPGTSEERLKNKPRNMFTDAVAWILHEKAGAPLRETSPMLTDILQQVPGFEKLQHGLVRMYGDRVLGKFVAIQHLIGGELLPFDDSAGAGGEI